jgi:hypothetical protein
MVAGLDGNETAYRALLKKLSDQLRAFFRGQLSRVSRGLVEAEEAVCPRRCGTRTATSALVNLSIALCSQFEMASVYEFARSLRMVTSSQSDSSVATHRLIRLTSELPSEVRHDERNGELRRMDDDGRYGCDLHHPSFGRGCGCEVPVLCQEWKYWCSVRSGRPKIREACGNRLVFRRSECRFHSEYPVLFEPVKKV